LVNRQEDSVGKYLREIGRIQLLSATEEIKLSRQIKDLLFIEAKREQIADPIGIPVTDEQLASAMDISKKQLRHRVYIGRKAKNKMVEANLRLVVSIAKKYVNRGLPLEDLIQEGSFGLIKAAEKFDAEKGYKFSTYATWWIRQSISRGVHDQCRSIRVPIHVWEQFNKIKKVTKELCESLGRKPTETEIADATNTSLEQLRFTVKSARAIDSIDRTVGKEEEITIGDFLTSDEDSLEDNLVYNLLKQDLNNILDTLTHQEAEVIRMRYGFDDGNFKSFQKIGEKINLTRERIRQIQIKTIRKLRCQNHTIKLKDYIF